jgi:hypothetical protein
MTPQPPCCPVCGKPYGFMDNLFRPTMCGPCWQTGDELPAARSVPATESSGPGSVPEPAMSSPTKVSARGPMIVTLVLVAAHFMTPVFFSAMPRTELRWDAAIVVSIWLVGAAVALSPAFDPATHDEATARIKRTRRYRRIWIWSALVVAAHLALTSFFEFVAMLGGLRAFRGIFE